MNWPVGILREGRAEEEDQPAEPEQTVEDLHCVAFNLKCSPLPRAAGLHGILLCENMGAEAMTISTRIVYCTKATAGYTPSNKVRVMHLSH